MNLRPFDSGLYTNTAFMTNELAYFLGGICAAQESVVVSGDTYVIAPFRSNYGYATQDQIEEHRQHIEIMANMLGAKCYDNQTVKNSVYDSGKMKLPGFAVYFKTKPDFSYATLYKEIISFLGSENFETQRCLLIGIFDGRGYIDCNKDSGKIRSIVIDCVNPEVGNFISTLLNLVGYNSSFEINQHRKRLGGGPDRKNQLRIRNHEDFFARIGLISPKKLEVGKKSLLALHHSVKITQEDNVLNGLRTMKGY